jgi:hypothetical protein
MQKEEPAGDASNTRVMVLVVPGTGTDAKS